MDYLDFPEILCLCEDPEFPIEYLRRRHLVDKKDHSILFYIISKNWQFDSATKSIIRILGNWDVLGGEYGLRPLNAAIKSRGGYESCKTFVEAGARLDVAETTLQSRRALSEYVTSLPEKTVQKFLEIEPGAICLKETPLEPLHLAVLKNNKDTVGLLLRHGANPNSLAGMLGTSLHLTTNHEVTNMLLAHGADINAKDGLGYTPLIHAIPRWEIDLVDLLVKAGADVDLICDGNVSALNLAIEYGSLQKVKILVDAKCNINGYPGVVPPLHLSAQMGQDDILGFLIKRGADLDIRHEDRAVLHVTRCPETISRLLAYGADVNAKDKSGSTPFMLAAKQRSVELMEVYLMAGTEVSPEHLLENNFLSWVVSNGLYHVLKSLISRCDLRQAIAEEKDLLLRAILNRHEGIAFLLLEEFPCLVAEDEVNLDHIIWETVEWSSPRLLQKILDEMKKVEAEDTIFMDGFVYAVALRRAEIVKLLPQALVKPIINLGPNFTSKLFVLAAGTLDAWENIQDTLEEHPANWMSDYEQWWPRNHENTEADLSILQTLIDLGADARQAEHLGIGILHVAAWRNDERIMSVLLAAGANPLYKDSEGHTPAYWAAKMSHHKMEKMLRLAEAEAVAKQPNEEVSE